MKYPFALHKKTILLILIFRLSLVGLFAQQPSHFFLGNDEFEGIQIYDIIQDDELNYWFATDQGFYKYDGYDFVSVECKGLKGQSAFGFVKNRSGAIFCYNLNNQILKIQNNHCSVFYELQENERSNDVFLEITDNNSLIVLTKTLLLFDEKGQQQIIPKVPPNYYFFPFQTTQGKTISHILGKDSILVIEGKDVSIIPLKNGSGKINGGLKFFRIRSKTYAVCTADKRYYFFDESNFTLELLSEKQIPHDKEFLRFYNENSQLWIAGTVSGVRIITDPGFVENPELLFSQYLISDVYKDNEGNILLSTFNHGVIVIPDLRIPDVLPIPKEHTIVSLYYDWEIGLLMGTLKGQLILYDGKKYETLCNDGSRPLQAVYSWPGFPYVLFDDGYVKAYNKRTGSIIPVHPGSLKNAAIIDEKTVYLALNTSVSKLVLSGQDKFEKELLPQLKIRSYAIAVEPLARQVFIATSDGLKIIDSLGRIRPAAFNGETVFANDIAIGSDKVFIASKKNGVLVFENDEITKQINPFVNQREAEVSKIKVAKNRIYINTSQGLVVMDINGKVVTQLNKVHGFSTNKIFDFDLVNGELWIAHSKGVQKLKVNQLTNRSQKPLIRISSIKVNDSIVENDPMHNSFNSDARKFLFILSSPSLRNRENIQYHYKLVGYDSEWQLATYNDNEVIYNALDPGNYVFMVKAENRKLFSETISYPFFISKPFYLRWWFFIVIGLVFIFITIIIYRRELKKQRRKAEMINEINLSRLTAIQSQMNPHFIFNSLNSIQDLVLKGDINNSYTFITKFSDLIRRTLNYSEKDFIDFEQEIKLIELYLSLEKLRFRSELNYVIEPNEVEDIMVPPMLIQPFIENALLHGLLHKEGSKEIRIRFELKKSILICTIDDNGIGREKAKEIKMRQRSEHESFSGQAIKKRFAILSNHFKGELGFEYEDLFQNDQPSGTRVILFIPVKRKF